MKKENVEQYMEMVDSYEPTFIMSNLSKYLEKGSSLLELGMGPGKDLIILSRDYKVVGSDNSNIFINKFKEKNTGIETMVVDAVEMNLDRKFDCIYSNKVLQHLNKHDFIKSLENHKKYLNTNGIVFMTLWRGEHKEELMFDGELRFTYYLEKDVKEIVEKGYEILSLEAYTECDEDDSLLVVLQKK